MFLIENEAILWVNFKQHYYLIHVMSTVAECLKDECCVYFQHQQQVIAAIKRAEQVTMQDLNSIIGVSGRLLWSSSHADNYCIHFNSLALIMLNEKWAISAFTYGFELCFWSLKRSFPGDYTQINTLSNATDAAVMRLKLGRRTFSRRGLPEIKCSSFEFTFWQLSSNC